MSALESGGIVLLCLSLAAAIGMLLRRRLPDHHLSAESKDVIKLATAVVGTLSALALGFLIASGKTAFDDAGAELKSSVARLVLLDRVMAHYGPETTEARRMLVDLVQARLQSWGTSDDDETGSGQVYDPGVEPIQEQLRALSPDTGARQSLQARALEVSGQVEADHWLLVETGSEGLPWAFLAILVFWLALLFFTFGLLAPGNSTVVGVLVVCSVSVAGAIFLVIDMAHPYIGSIRISELPLQTALEHLGR